MIRYVRNADDGDGRVSARAEVIVGASSRTLTVPLGVWPPDAPDPGGPLGLASLPVVITQRSAASTLVEAGARRSGRGPSVDRLPASPRIGLDLLASANDGAEVQIVDRGDAATLRIVRVLGGRPLMAIPLGRPTLAAGMLDGLDVDVLVPLPSGDDELRARVRAIVAPLGLESLHHVVEVDPRPAFDEADVDARVAGLDELAAAAAGVLAGRIAAGNARWRRDVAG